MGFYALQLLATILIWPMWGDEEPRKVLLSVAIPIIGVGCGFWYARRKRGSVYGIAILLMLGLAGPGLVAGLSSSPVEIGYLVLVGCLVLTMNLPHLVCVCYAYRHWDLFE